MIPNVKLPYRLGRSSPKWPMMCSVRGRITLL